MVTLHSTSFPCLAVIQNFNIPEEKQSAVYEMGFAMRKLYTVSTAGQNAEAHTLYTDAFRRWPGSKLALEHLHELYKDVESEFGWGK